MIDHAKKNGTADIEVRVLVFITSALHLVVQSDKGYIDSTIT